MVKIVCMCKQLVEVVDKSISEHEVRGDGVRCPASGMKYAPQKLGNRFPGQPGVEILAQGPIECPNCGESDGAYGILARVSGGDPSLN